jgi:rod shape-determining protein MreD
VNPYATIALLGLVAIVQSTFLARLDPSGVHPDLTLLTVISWSFLRGSREGVGWGFVGGLALDLLSGAPLGLNAILMTVAGYLAGLGEARVFRSNIILPIFIISSVSLGYFAVQFVAMQFLGRSLPLLETFLFVALPTVALNLLASPFVFHLLRWLSFHTGHEQLRW